MNRAQQLFIQLDEAQVLYRYEGETYYRSKYKWDKVEPKIGPCGAGIYSNVDLTKQLSRNKISVLGPVLIRLHVDWTGYLILPVPQARNMLGAGFKVHSQLDATDSFIPMSDEAKQAVEAYDAKPERWHPELATILGQERSAGRLMVPGMMYHTEAEGLMVVSYDQKTVTVKDWSWSERGTQSELLWTGRGMGGRMKQELWRMFQGSNFRYHDVNDPLADTAVAIVRNNQRLVSIGMKRFTIRIDNEIEGQVNIEYAVDGRPDYTKFSEDQAKLVEADWARAIRGAIDITGNMESNHTVTAGSNMTFQYRFTTVNEFHSKEVEVNSHGIVSDIRIL